MLPLPFLDFHVVFQQQSYQASSIHSRRRLSFMSATRQRTITSPLPTESPPPPPLPPTAQQPSSSSPSPTTTAGQDFILSSTNENRLLSDLWLMSAATFRRVGKIDQAKGAIQEAEVRDENNPAVWVQVCCLGSAFFSRSPVVCVVLTKATKK